MQITESKIVATLSPCEGNPRNSEGCFLRLDDGRIAFAYSRYIGDSAHDHAACQIACIYSHDNGESFDTEHIETLVNAEEYGAPPFWSWRARPWASSASAASAQR